MYYNWTLENCLSVKEALEKSLFLKLWSYIDSWWWLHCSTLRPIRVSPKITCTELRGNVHTAQTDFSWCSRRSRFSNRFWLTRKKVNRKNMKNLAWHQTNDVNVQQCQQQCYTFLNHIWQHGWHGGLVANHNDISAAIETVTPIAIHTFDVIFQLLAERTIIGCTRQLALQNVKTKDLSKKTPGRNLPHVVTVWLIVCIADKCLTSCRLETK